MADLSGSRLGPFEIRSLLGTGGFATVYRAHDPRLASEVAIKILAENHSLDPEIRARFIGEAHALRRVESASVISIFDIRETDDGRPYLVLEFADRGDLVGRRNSLAANGWQPNATDAMAVVDSLAEALDAIHAEELVHRDVTPSNLLIRSRRRQSDRPGVSVIEPDELFLLSDMGLVKDLSAGSGLTVGGGTAGFWAPEQREALAAVDHRTDLFSATAVVAWLLIGHAPITTPDWPDRIAAAQWPPAVANALARGLAQDPDQRPGTAVEWRTELAAAFAQSPEAPSAPSAVTDVGVGPPPDIAAPPLPDTAARLAANQPTSGLTTPSSTAAVSGTAASAAAPGTETATTDQDNAGHTGAASMTNRPNRKALLGAALVATLVVLGLVAALLLRSGPLNADGVELPDGRVAVTTEVDGASLTVIGPERARVGEVMQFSTESSGLSTIRWLAPDGATWDDPVLEVRTANAGRGTVLASGFTADGTQVRAELTFEAEDG